MTTYKFNGTKNGETLSFFLANKELKVGSALVRISDGYIVSYVSAINGTTITVQGRTYTETFTDVVSTGETEEVASYTGWIDICGDGSDGGEEGTSIFYGTMDEWNALSTDAKKQYDYMSDEQNGTDGVYPSAPTTPEIVFDKINQSSNIDSTYTVTKKAFHIVRVHCYSERESHSAQVYLNGVNISNESSYQTTSGVGYSVTIPCNVGDAIRMVVSCGGSGTYDKRSAAIYRLN